MGLINSNCRLTLTQPQPQPKEIDFPVWLPSPIHLNPNLSNPNPDQSGTLFGQVGQFWDKNKLS